MKKIIISVLAVALVLSVVLSCVACNNKEGAAVTTEYDASKAAIYTMDLSGIEGYADKSVENGTWAQTYDVLIGYIKKETDTVKRYQLMHVAEDILMETGNIVPLYYYTDTFMKSTKLSGFFSSPLGYKYFMYSSLSDGAKALNACLASEPQSIDPALNSAVDGATMLIHLFSGLVKYDKDLNLVADAAEALPEPEIAENGEATYVFTLREGMKWSNGEAVLASDFEWAWKRAASDALGADYGYMFEVVKGFDQDDVDGLKPLAVTANDEARTLTVTLTVDVPYFYELCAFPTYMPLYNRANHVIDADGTWATKPETYICNGAYTLKSWSHNELIVLEKNPNYFDADNVTMDTLNLYLSDDANTMLNNYKKGDWLFIDDVPNEEIPALKRDYPNEFTVTGQLGTYYVCFNNNLSFVPADKAKDMSVEELSLANAEIRKAISLLLDRTYICEEIGQSGQQPASSFVALGLTDPSNNGEEFYLHAGHNDGYVGYYDATKAANATNAAKAVATLKKYFNYNESTGKFTNFPTFTYLYNTSSGHQAIGEYIQGAVANYGITMKLSNQEWATFLETRKNGDYGVARNGWLGDYNDPISFLDMWTTGSGNNDVQFGKYSKK